MNKGRPKRGGPLFIPRRAKVELPYFVHSYIVNLFNYNDLYYIAFH